VELEFGIMNKNRRTTKAFQNPLFIVSVILVCVSAVAVFLVLNKYKSSESNQAKSGEILESANSAKTQSPVQADSLSPPQSADILNSISTQQAPAISQDNFSDQSGSLFTKDQQAEAKNKAAVSRILNLLTGQSRQDKFSADELAKKLALVLDKNALLKDRCDAALLLAKYGDSGILHELKRLLADTTTPAELRAAILEGIGSSDDPHKKDIALSAINDQSEPVVIAAINGLVLVGDDDCVSILSDIAKSPDESDNIRSEAVMGLGRIPGSGAYTSLVDLYHNESAKMNVSVTDSDDDTDNDIDTELLEDIIASLGQRDIAETGAFFGQILKEKDLSTEIRVATANSLEESHGDVSPFLINMLHDENAEVRAAAALSFANREEPGDIAREAESLVQKEQDARVRENLYKALGNQENVDFNSIVPVILNESDYNAKLAGYDLLAKNIELSQNAELKQQFENAIVPQLKDTALNADILNCRLSAIVTLKKASTPQSIIALGEIAGLATDNRIIEATEIQK
jgi:hypothetical protein